MATRTYIVKGCTLQSHAKAGARVRQSRYVPHRAASNLSRAVSFAGEIGRPLDTLVTINYGLTYTDERDMTAAFRRLIKSFYGKWFARHPAHRMIADKAPTYVWVAEGRPGHHGIHWLVYLPFDLKAEFERQLPRWIQKTAGDLLDTKAVQVQHAWRPAGAAEYMLKGLRPSHAKRYKIKAVFQGDVYGKRCAVSENLGPTAIRRYREAKAAAASCEADALAAG